MAARRAGAAAGEAGGGSVCLMNAAADDPQGQAQLAAFRQVLQQLGWSDGGNVRIDTRWARTMLTLIADTRRN